MKTFIRRYYPLAIFIFLAFLFFHEFFIKGYLLEGSGDRIRSMVPLDLYALRSVHAGHLPQWNPHLACGVPYLTTGYHNFFYPLKLLTYASPETMFLFLLTLAAFCHMVLSGIFFYLFAGTIIRDKFWQTMSAVTYMLSFTLTYNMVYGDDCVIPLVYTPLLLYLINTRANRRAALNVMLMAVIVALIIVSGNIQLILYTLGLSFLYGCYKAFAGRATVDKSFLGVLAAAYAAALLMTAVRTVPFIMSLGDFTSGFSSSFADLAKFDLTKPIALLRLFAPLFFSGDNAFFMAGLCPPVSFNIYLGILAAYFIVYTAVVIWNRETVFWKIVILFIVLIILGTPLAKFQYMLLGKAYLTYSRYAWLLPIPLALFFGIAGSAITKDA
ncbi:MAG: hypothetical protein PHS37_05810 [Candidatus Omnitrophica bacterium]|nr:hypothetical protein [Candidatus Omnitrophota bacterium]